MNSFSVDFASHGKKMFECLFGRFFQENSGYIEYRVLGKSDGKQVPPQSLFYDSLQKAISSEIVDGLTEMNEHGLNIYVGVCPRLQERGKEEDVVYITNLWADIDFKDFPNGEVEAWEMVERFPLKPSLINATGHGLHLFWLLDQTYPVTDLPKIKGIIKGVGKALNGDSVFDLSRVMRVPGFVNRKPDKEPILAVLLEEYFHPELQYTLLEFEKYWVDPEAGEKSVKLNDLPEKVPERFSELLRTDKHLSDTWFGRRKMPTKSTRSEYDLSIADQLVDRSFTNEEIAMILPCSPSGKGEDCTIQYLERTIGKARVKSTESKQESLPDYRELLAIVPENTPKEDLPEALEPFFRALAYENHAKISSVITFNVKTRFDLTNDVLKKYEKTVLLYKKQIPPTSKEVVPAQTFSEEELASAEGLLLRPTLLHDILLLLRKLGLVGEERNALTHYFGFTSRLLEQPISITVKGDSSAGKSFTLAKVMKLVPKVAYIDITDATPQSFFYGPEDQFKHRIIVIFEIHGAEKANYSIRTLQSEGKLAIQVTMKNPETGAFEAKTVEREGPTGFITTTTSSAIHSENETRVLSIFPDQSHAQTKRVYAAANERFLGKRQMNSSALNEYCALQTLLKPYPVLIPYVESLAQYFPHEILRTRRDYSRFLALVETSAILHQEQRPKQEIDGTVFLRATLADYEIARILCEESLLKSIYELPPKTVELIHKAAGLLKDGKGSENGTFTITDLSKELGWDRDTVTNWLKQAQKKTFITLVAENIGNKGARYCLEAKPLPNDSFLPTVETLARLNPNESTEGIYNPITGEHVVIKKSAPPDAVPTVTNSTQDISSSAQPSEHASGNSDKNID